MSELIPHRTREQTLSGRQPAQGRLFDLRTQLARLFDEFYSEGFELSPAFAESGELGDFAPRLDIDETDSQLIVTAELPGLKPEDLEVALDDDLLTIQGEKRDELEEQEVHSYHIERSYGSFARSLRLPSDVESEKVTAVLKDGLLRIELPKSKQAREKSRRIPIKAG